MVNENLIKLICLLQLKQMEMEVLESEGLLYKALFIRQYLKLKRMKRDLRRRRYIWKKVNFPYFLNKFVILMLLGKPRTETQRFGKRLCPKWMRLTLRIAFASAGQHLVK